MVIFRLSAEQSVRYVGNKDSTDQFLKQNVGKTSEFGLHLGAATDGIDMFDLGRMWSVMDFSLAEIVGHPERLPLGEGADVGSDFGYGPAQLHTVESVQTLALALEPHADISDFVESDIFQKEIMSPDDWDEFDDEARKTFVKTYQELRQFILKAGERRNILLVSFF